MLSCKPDQPSLSFVAFTSYTSFVLFCFIQEDVFWSDVDFICDLTFQILVHNPLPLKSAV